MGAIEIVDRGNRPKVDPQRSGGPCVGVIAFPPLMLAPCPHCGDLLTRFLLDAHIRRCAPVVAKPSFVRCSVCGKPIKAIGMERHMRGAHSRAIRRLRASVGEA